MAILTKEGGGVSPCYNNICYFLYLENFMNDVYDVGDEKAWKSIVPKPSTIQFEGDDDHEHKEVLSLFFSISISKVCLQVG